ncbi:MAG: phosphatidylglycerophosphatase A [Chloroherpetonaceae bacterium]|nr:phosphatidylglycerophosphatase A [Chloroherpetonaceae bacterium]MDW8436793.1 phosphatidylglycerophosphatase A [Chloroherpetonaceae bacterium]
MNWLAKIFGTGFGTGYLPYIPGTWGSLVALLTAWFAPSVAEVPTFFYVIVGFFAIGVWAGGEIEKDYGKDAKEITIDEFVGQWVALLFVPRTYLAFALAFVFFRFFDIAKIEPINKLQKLPKGWGVMLDDVVAGVYANLSVQIALWLIGRF